MLYLNQGPITLETPTNLGAWLFLYNSVMKSMIYPLFCNI